MSIEANVARHYTHGSLERAILDALISQGKEPDHLTPADLAPIDEFHIGGRQATIDFAGQLGVRRGMRLLDIGCGLGGAARYFADEHGCRVVGIDLTNEFVEVANSLAQRVGLGRIVSYQQGSALDLPFATGSFDGAYMLHVGMNIADKRKLFAGVRAVLKAGGLFGIYDVMRTGNGELTFPVPWASSPETSFVSDAASYRSLLEAASFEVVKERNRRDFAVDFFRQTRARAAQGPALGIHLLMGVEFAQKMANLIGNFERGLIAPAELICRAI
jgi:ubiquinone/menaquinone biosynthesis C-methylase UbiE